MWRLSQEHEYLCIGGGKKEEGTIRIGDVQVNRVKDFEYLGSTVQEDGGTEQGIARRIQSGWISWKKITGVERKLEVAEMRVMRYEVGVTRLAKIKNETTREILGIERYSEKIRESRLSWFGYVYRRDEEYVGKSYE
ncbi:uncharacterized protein LOC134767524 [Penaeus indicus]|uniref:uncharacterized protein LOC134767524 n=1 Tax=Penaeus indicus TaxID=29960 RepID=UPI00300D0722